MATKKKADDEVVEDAADAPEQVPAPDTTDEPADAAVEESTGEVTEDEEAAEDEVEDAIGPAVTSNVTTTPVAVTSIVTTTPVIPAPITAHTGPTAKHRRVLYENRVNEGAEAFAARARATYIEVVLAGGTVELVVTFPSLPTNAEE